jgi:hypothetical protein
MMVKGAATASKIGVTEAEKLVMEGLYIYIRHWVYYQTFNMFFVLSPCPV